MKKEIAEQWADALESGKYQQGFDGYLRRGDNWCCLGVLCDVVGSPSHDVYENGRFYFGNGPVERDAVHLPKSVMELCELKSVSPKIGHQYLTNTNDNGASFKVIAKLIRENWEQL